MKTHEMTYSITVTESDLPSNIHEEWKKMAGSVGFVGEIRASGRVIKEHENIDGYNRYEKYAEIDDFEVQDIEIVTIKKGHKIRQPTKEEIDWITDAIYDRFEYEITDEWLS